MDFEKYQQRFLQWLMKLPERVSNDNLGCLDLLFVIVGIGVMGTCVVPCCAGVTSGDGSSSEPTSETTAEKAKSQSCPDFKKPGDSPVGIRGHFVVSEQSPDIEGTISFNGCDFKIEKQQDISLLKAQWESVDWAKVKTIKLRLKEKDITSDEKFRPMNSEREDDAPVWFATADAVVQVGPVDQLITDDKKFRKSATKLGAVRLVRKGRTFLEKDQVAKAAEFTANACRFVQQQSGVPEAITKRVLNLKDELRKEVSSKNDAGDQGSSNDYNIDLESISAKCQDLQRQHSCADFEDPVDSPVGLRGVSFVDESSPDMSGTALFNGCRFEIPETGNSSTFEANWKTVAWPDVEKIEIRLKENNPVSSTGLESMARKREDDGPVWLANANAVVQVGPANKLLDVDSEGFRKAAVTKQVERLVGQAKMELDNGRLSEATDAVGTARQIAKYSNEEISEPVVNQIEKVEKEVVGKTVSSTVKKARKKLESNKTKKALTIASSKRKKLEKAGIDPSAFQELISIESKTRKQIWSDSIRRRGEWIETKKGKLNVRRAEVHQKLVNHQQDPIKFEKKRLRSGEESYWVVIHITEINKANKMTFGSAGGGMHLKNESLRDLTNTSHPSAHEFGRYYLHKHFPRRVPKGQMLDFEIGTGESFRYRRFYKVPSHVDRDHLYFQFDAADGTVRVPLF